ncbi:MAG: Aspartate ammonia-lyase [Phycisphaerae bacterium]|nr:Aspartate ammonia-lyase [Phycisphaerae bacterium]
MGNSDFRIEKDSMGEVKVPADAYYGVQTQRGADNFPISGLREHPKFIESFVELKLAAAIVNTNLGAVDKERGQAIQQACREILADLPKWIGQFVIDVFQAGAGTSFHMNVNEVVANRALELLGDQRGNYKRLSANDHVNFGQSTNDTVPTTIHVTALKLGGELVGVVGRLADAFAAKAEQFKGVIKSGRTHLQDAVPITLGQEFRGYAAALRQSAELIDAATVPLRQLCLGGSAVGTGLNSLPKYRELVIAELGKLTHLPLAVPDDPRRAMQSMQPVAHFHATVRNLALELTRIANDLRLLSSGPTTGLAEIVLPGVQPGSSIMPGKVNPVMAECLNMVCYEVIGNDATVAYATQAGQMELNVMMPLLAHKVNSSCDLFIKYLPLFEAWCVQGITADEARCRMYFESSVSLATILNPLIGYLKAAEVVKEAVKTGKPILQVVREKNVADPDKLAELLKPENVTGPLH